MANGSDRTIKEWCSQHGVSASFYFSIQRKGLGPQVTKVPGTRFRRITQDADAEWQVRMAELAATKAAQLEQQRFIERQREIGKRAATSNKHHGKRRAAASGGG